MTVHAWAGPAVGRRTSRQHAAVSSGGLVGRVLELQRLAGNRAVSRALARTVQRTPGDEQKPPDVITGAEKAPPKRVTGYIGLNPMAGKEAAGLRRASKGAILTSLNDPVAEKKLQEDPAVGAFIGSELGFASSPVRALQAATLLTQADPHLREQLADVMRWMNQAEKGEIILDRLVLSGHSDGVKLWGESEEADASKPGVMIIERDLGMLGTIFPKAVGQVQDIMFSACFSINAVEIVKRIFPKLESVWSYGGYSPSAANGAIDHIVTWSVATEGEKTPGKGQKRGSNAIWTREKGYIVGDPSQAAAGPLVTEASRGGNEWVGPYYRGEKEVDKATLDRFYIVLQQLEAHPGVAAEAKKNITTRVIPITLRLRHWKPISERFGKTYGAELKPAYDALGISPPNWSTLTRTGLKAHLEAIDKALTSNPGASPHKSLIDEKLRKGLFKLDPDVIKPDWI